MRELDPKTLKENVFSLFDDRWTLITAGTQDACNTMTASWGGLGVLWHRPVATIYVRPQRYTYEFLEKSDWFTLSFLPEDLREVLAYCGSASGRDVDKFAACGIHPAFSVDGAPYVQEAQLVLVCRKRYWNDLDPANMDELGLENYKARDYHRMYIGEIVRVLEK